MSLINEALKRVEQSLNENSPDQKLKPQMSSFPMEPDKRNKTLFLVAILGGTLFFSIFILLLFLIFSNYPSSSSSTNLTTPPTPGLTNALISQPQDAENEKSSSSLENSIPPSETSTVEKSQNENEIAQEPDNLSLETLAAAPAPEENHKDSNESSKAIATNETPEKDLNKEIFEGMINLASKAFTRVPTQSKTKEVAKESNVEQSKNDNAEKPVETNYKLSTAQDTLEKIQRESDTLKEAPKSKVEQFIDSLAVTGVMISKDDSMALINNRVFPKNSIIDANFNLTLVDIYPQKIVLRDGMGNTYDVEF